MSIKEYRLRNIRAVQITEAMFADPHPNGEHLHGVRYEPEFRRVCIDQSCGIVSFGRVGDYILIDEGRAVAINSKTYFEKEYVLAEREDPFEPPTESKENIIAPPFAGTDLSDYVRVLRSVRAITGEPACGSLNGTPVYVEYDSDEGERDAMNRWSKLRERKS